MKDPAKRTLDELLAKLPTDVPVPRDLWPQIARGIRSRPRNLRDFAIAASLVLVCMAGGLSWVYLHGRAAIGPATASKAPVATFAEPSDPAYLAARAVLENSFRERLALLDPTTRAQVEASLAEIRRAHAQIGEALAAEPANPVLEHLWESTWHDEFDLYDSVVVGTQPSILRSLS